MHGHIKKFQTGCIKLKEVKLANKYVAIINSRWYVTNLSKIFVILT